MRPCWRMRPRLATFPAAPCPKPRPMVTQHTLWSPTSPSSWLHAAQAMWLASRRSCSASHGRAAWGWHPMTATAALQARAQEPTGRLNLRLGWGRACSASLTRDPHQIVQHTWVLPTARSHPPSAAWGLWGGSSSSSSATFHSAAALSCPLMRAGEARLGPVQGPHTPMLGHPHSQPRGGWASERALHAHAGPL